MQSAYLSVIFHSRGFSLISILGKIEDVSQDGDHCW